MTDRLSLPLFVLGVLGMLGLLLRVLVAGISIEYALAQALDPSTPPPVLPPWRNLLARLLVRAVSGLWVTSEEAVVLRMPAHAATLADWAAAPPVPAFEAVEVPAVWLPMPTSATLLHVQKETAYLCERLRPDKTAFHAVDDLEAASRASFAALDAEEQKVARALLAPYYTAYKIFLDRVAEGEASLRTPPPSSPSEDVGPVVVASDRDA